MRYLLAFLALAALINPAIAEDAKAPTPEDSIAAAVAAPVAGDALTPPTAVEAETPPAPADDAEPAVEAEADAGDPVQELGDAVKGDGTSTWRSILGTIITIVGLFLTKWVRSASLKKAEHYEKIAQNTDQDTKTRVVARAKGYIWRRAAEIQEYELPELASAVVRKQISADQLKRRLRMLGDRLIDDTVTYFERQDIDVIAEFGRDQLVSWIRSAVDDISIFKKWPTAKVLVEGGAEAILAVGMDKAGDYYDGLRKKVIAGEEGGSGAEASGTVEGKIVSKIEKSVSEEFKPAGE